MPFKDQICQHGNDDLELIETMRQMPCGGFIRLERHLSRLSSSAEKLGFIYHKAKVRKKLEEISLAHEENHRVRLLLRKDGSINLFTEVFTPLPAQVRWRVRIAKTQLSSSNKLLQHKTTKREVLQEARNEFTIDEADEVIMMNERNEICEGVRTNIFVLMKGEKQMITPPVSCGLLPGVLRQELLDTGQAIEKTISLKMLTMAKAIFVGNSLNGLRSICLDQ